MDTLVIDDFIRKEQWLNVPTCTVVEAEKKSFDEAVADCNAVPLEAFIAELKTRVKKRYHNAKG
jgi:hypothetical protein